MEGPCKKRKACPPQLGEFPRLVLHNIMKHLSAHKVLQLGLTCSRVHDVSKNDLLWKFLTKRDFGVQEKLVIDKTWKAVYQEEYYCSNQLSSWQIDYCEIFTVLTWEKLSSSLIKCAIRHNHNPAADNNRAICWAADNGQDKVVEFLLADERVDPAADNNYAICWAACYGHTKVVKLLLADERVDPAAGDNLASRLAADNGHDKVVELLLADPRVDPAARNNLAIRWAAECGREKVVELLLADPRVDPAATGWDGKSVIDLAREKGHAHILELLENKNHQKK